MSSRINDLGVIKKSKKDTKNKMEKRKLIETIAEEWKAARHQPKHDSYTAFSLETQVQFWGLFEDGLNIIRWSHNPYSNSNEMFNSIENKKVLKVLMDCAGSPLAADHPLSLIHENCGLSVNEMFRAVHDYYGHYKIRAPFETFEGEIAAYNNHKKYYSAAAAHALYSETVGQLCYHSHFGTFVPEQKCVIIPIRF